jgi:DNA-binding transcriptional LysR family regulator
LPQLFRRGRFEFLITIEKLNDVTLEEHNLGVERYVLIESSIKNARKCTYLDHDEGDKYTTDFFALQGWEDRKFSRSYLDDNHGILSGVQQGLGKAVVPIHLLRTQSGIKVVKGLTPLEKPIYFYYFKQNFYSRLHQEVVKALIAETKKFLE